MDEGISKDRRFEGACGNLGMGKRSKEVEQGDQQCLGNHSKMLEAQVD